MPLAFPSLSHGEIAFGFFNIESDLLLLNNYFFFASDFCRDLSGLASSALNQQVHRDWDVYILDRKDMGDLRGAINGQDLWGFIGETYRLFPFPQEQHFFKQNPAGYKTRTTIQTSIEKYAKLSRIAVIVEASGHALSIGEYTFSRKVFHSLLNYVWAGGYPLWKDGARPDYVRKMKTDALQSAHPLFSGIDFTG